MIIEKTLEERICFSDSNDIYSKDINETVIKHLSKLNGKCYQSCLIIAITKILRISQIYMSDQLDGSAYLNVRFLVDALVYQEKEILPCCKVRQIEANGQIYADSEYAKIQILPNEKTKYLSSIFKIGDNIPVSVYRVSYGISKDKISVLATPFSPNFDTTIIYKVGEKLSQDQKDTLNRLNEKISKTEKAVSLLSKPEEKAYEFFKKILYPYKEIVQNKTINILDLDNFSDQYVSRPSNLEKHYKTCCIYKSIEKIQPSVVSENSVFEISCIFLSDYLQHITTLMEFVKNYPDVKTIAKYAEIWKLYNLLKR